MWLDIPNTSVGHRRVSLKLILKLYCHGKTMANLEKSRGTQANVERDAETMAPQSIGTVIRTVPDELIYTNSTPSYIAPIKSSLSPRSLLQWSS